MSFKTVASQIMRKQGISREAANAMLTSNTRRIMKKRRISTKHGIPKGVFSKFKQKASE
jgi:hypothetical protein